MVSVRRRHGVTLLETLLAVSLLVVLMRLLFSFYDSSLAASKEGLARTRDVQLARVILERIAGEIRLASGTTGNFGPGLVGHEESISVNTLVIPSRFLSERRTLTDEQVAGQFDLQEVRYYIAWDEENLDENGDPRPLGLVRRVSKTFNRGLYIQPTAKDDQQEVEDEEALAVKEELYAPEIKFLEFRYFDGGSWWKDWELSGGNTLPMIVRVTVGYEAVLPEDMEELDLIDDNFLVDEEERERVADDRYTLFVKLVQADTNPIGVRLQRQAAALAEPEESEEPTESDEDLEESS